MLASTFEIAAAAILASQAAAPQTTLELQGRTRDNVGGAEVTVGADGIIIKCAPVDKEYWNSMTPPEICGAYPVGSRYGPPTTYKGKPMARKIKIMITTHDVNIAR